MVFRRRSLTPPDPLAAIDPGRLPATYRTPVVDAVRARTKFSELVTGLHDGPLRERLRELTTRVDSGVLAVWHTASRAADIDRMTATLDVERVTAELKQARRSGASDEVVVALQERFASMQRLLNGRDAQRDRLPVLEARLATAVARAAELVLMSPASVSTEIDALAGDLDRLVVELEALGAATTELG